MADATDAKGGYDGHCAVVSHLAVLIAMSLGWQGRQLAQIRVAGLLHDVGKLTTPDPILLAPRKLTPWEFSIIKDHSTRGHAFLMGLGLDEEARWVLHHHEHFNGDGYPSGIAGDAIPLGARILHVADAFEAIVATRPYRPPRAPNEAVAEIHRASGTQFCPIIATALEAVVKQQGGAQEVASATA